MDPGTEASRAAIAAERRRSIRFVAWFRFLGISIAFALNEILPSLLHGARPFPFAFLLQWTVVLRNPAISAVPLAGTIFFMLLVLAAAFSLEAWRIVLAAAVGAAAEVWRGPHRGVHQGRRRAILVSEVTRRQAGDAIEFARAGPAHLRGRSQAVEVYEPRTGPP